MTIDSRPKTEATASAALDHVGAGSGEFDDFRDYFENATLGMHFVGADGTILYANRADSELLGYSREEWIGHNLSEFYVDQDTLGDIFARLGNGEILSNVEARMIARDGSICDVLIDSNALFRDGEFVHTRCVVRGNRVEKRAVADLRASEDRYRSLAESIPALVSTADAEGIVNYHNQRWMEYTGRTADELRRDWASIVHPEDLGPLVEKWPIALAAGMAMENEYRVLRHDGEYRWHRSITTPAPDAANRVHMWIDAAIDVHDRREAEDALQQALESTATVNLQLAYQLGVNRMITENAGSALFLLDRDGSPTFMNRSAEQMTGFRLEDICGVPLHESVHHSHPDGTSYVMGDCPIYQSSPTMTPLRDHEDVFYRKNGEPFPVLISVAPLESEGEGIGAVVEVLDITHRKQAEEERDELIGELQRANTAKDEFLGMVSHELKTPITTILGNAEILRLRSEQLTAEDRAGALDDIAKESERLQRIIDNLLVLARLEHGQSISPEPLLVPRVIERLAAVHRQHFPHRQIRVSGGAGIPPANGEGTYLEQVIRNLLSNAEKYSAPTAPIVVDLSQDGVEVRVSVLDSGSGFGEGEAEKIFTPFYRSPQTATQASGVGIGLAVCQRLIAAQGGHMWARNRPEGGADIGFALPVAEDHGE